MPTNYMLGMSRYFEQMLAYGTLNHKHLKETPTLIHSGTPTSISSSLAFDSFSMSPTHFLDKEWMDALLETENSAYMTIISYRSRDASLIETSRYLADGQKEILA